jgi:CBS domain-containing protein
MSGNDQKADIGALDALAQETLLVMLHLGDLTNKIAAHATPVEINASFAVLVEMASAHFAREETIMEQNAFPGLPWHRVVHRELLNEMRLALAKCTAERISVDKEMLLRVRGVFVQEGQDEDAFRARAKLGLFREVIHDVRPADLAAALPNFDKQERGAIFSDLGALQASGTLEEVAPPLQRELVSALPIERVADLIDLMRPAQAANVLRNLTPAESWGVMQHLGPVRSRKIAALVEKQQKESLLHLSTLRYIRVEPAMSCGELLKRYRALATQALVWRFIYIIAPNGVMLGVADMKDILVAEPALTMADVMMTNTVSLTTRDTLETAAGLFEHYEFDALPVIDELGELRGVLVARDVLGTDE